MDFITQLPNIAQAVADMFVSLFSALSAIFYTPATTGAEASPGSLTFIGVLTIIVLFIGLCLMLVNWIRSLVRGGSRR